MIYSLNEMETKKEKCFIQKHKTHSGEIYYKLFPTGIGMIVHIVCKACEKDFQVNLEEQEEDITDYDNF